MYFPRQQSRLSFPALTSSSPLLVQCPALLPTSCPDRKGAAPKDYSGWEGVRLDKDTPVSATLGPVFPPGLLLKWGTDLGHIKSIEAKSRWGSDTQGTLLGHFFFFF